MLELLITLARDLSFQMDGEVRAWFWHLIEVLGLTHCSDRYYDKQAEMEIHEALERVIFRTYEPSGEGGLFPLQHPREDQRNVELWYQLNAYILELP